VQVLGLTMGAAVTAMVIGQVLAGVPVSPVELVMFPTLALVNVVLLVLLLRSISERPLPADVASHRPIAPRPGDVLPAPR
jgi:hypothetical protein